VAGTPGALAGRIVVAVAAGVAPVAAAWLLRDVLDTLAAGQHGGLLGFEVIGCSMRTVQRHIRDLMRMVGAQTRFQLGIAAIRGRWV
jgi:predicted membrane-bound mannosyltransferase